MDEASFTQLSHVTLLAENARVKTDIILVMCDLFMSARCVHVVVNTC
jgi:hypothetical protein